MWEIIRQAYLVCGVYVQKRAEEKETHEENFFVRKSEADFFSSPRKTILISTLFFDALIVA